MFALTFHGVDICAVSRALGATAPVWAVGRVAHRVGGAVVRVELDRLVARIGGRVGAERVVGMALEAELVLLVIRRVVEDLPHIGGGGKPGPRAVSRLDAPGPEQGVSDPVAGRGVGPGLGPVGLWQSQHSAWRLPIPGSRRRAPGLMWTPVVVSVGCLEALAKRFLMFLAPSKAGEPWQL